MIRKKTIPLQKKLNVPLLVGLLIFGVSIVILAWFIPCPTPIQELLFRLLMSIGAACVVTIIPGLLKVDIAGLKAFGAIGVFVIVYLYNPAKLVQNDDKCRIQFTNCTVFVHGKKGNQDMILRQKGYVIMDLGGGERKRASINENGEAFFQNLLIGDSVRLNIDFSEPYKALNSDTMYVIEPNDQIYLEIALQGIDKVFGKVLYNDEPLDNVRVQIDTLQSITDNTGNFLLLIPGKMQKKRYEVWFFKKNFKSISVTAFPQTGEPIDLIMQKK